MAKYKLIILIPCEETIKTDSWLSLTNLFLNLKNQGIEYIFYTVCGSAHAFARNTLYQKALDLMKVETDYTHVLWIDSDQIFVCEDVYRLLTSMDDYNSNVMSATYLTKFKPISAVALKIESYNDDGTPKRYRMISEFDKDKLYDIDSAGLGMFMMRTKVLQELEKKYGRFVFEFPIRYDIVIGEDIGFCERIKSLGYNIELNTNVIIGHAFMANMDLQMAQRMMLPIKKNDPNSVDATPIGWMDPEEADTLQILANSISNGAIVEIGSWKGLSTIKLGSGTKSGYNQTVYAIDTFTGSPEHKEKYGTIETYTEFMENIKDAYLDDVIVPIRKTSEEAFKEFEREVGMLFIDGDHSYEMVKKDYDMWSTLLVSGGVLAFHDNNWEGPARVIEEVRNNGLYEEIGTAKTLTYFKKK